MKFNTLIVLLCLFSTIYFEAKCSNSFKSSMERLDLSNRYESALQKKMQNEILENLSSKGFAPQNDQEKRRVQKFVHRITKSISEKIIRQTNITEVIYSDPINASNNFETGVQQIVNKTLSNKNLSKVLSKVEAKNGPLSNKSKLIEDLNSAIKEKYLQNNPSVQEEIRSIATNIKNKENRKPKNLNIQKMVKDSKILNNLQDHHTNRNLKKVQQIQQKVKQAAKVVDAVPEAKTCKVIRASLPDSEKKDIAKIDSDIARVHRIENYLKTQLSNHRNSQRIIKRITKVLLRTRRAEKFLQNKKLNKISKNLFKGAVTSLNKIKSLKNNIKNAKNPENKKLLSKMLSKEMKKAKTMVEIVKKINKHIVKNLKNEQKIQRVIKNKNTPNQIRKVTRVTAVSPKIAKKQVILLAQRIKQNLIRNGCNAPQVVNLVGKIVKIASNVKIQKNTKPVTRRQSKVNIAIPKRVTKSMTKVVAKIMKRANLTKNLNGENLNRESKIIANKILKASTSKKIAVSVAKEFAKKVTRDPKATFSAKRLATKILNLVKNQKSNKIPNNIRRNLTKKIVKKAKIQNKKVNQNDKCINDRDKKYIEKISVGILKKADNAHEAKELAKRHALKIFRSKGVTSSMKKMAIQIYKNVKKHIESKAVEQKLRKNINAIQKEILKIKVINKSQSLNLSKKIANKMIKNAKSNLVAKQIAANFAINTAKNPKATSTQKQLALNVYNKVKNTIKNEQKLSKKEKIGLVKVTKVLPEICVSPIKAKKTAINIEKVIKINFGNTKLPEKLNKISKKISVSIVKKAKNPEAAILLAKSLLNKALSNKKPNIQTIKIAVKVLNDTMKNIKENKNPNKTKSKVIKIVKNFVNSKKKVSAKIDKEINRISSLIIKKASDSKNAKEIVKKLTIKVLQDPKSTPNMKRIAVKIYNKVSQKIVKINNQKKEIINKKIKSAQKVLEKNIKTLNNLKTNNLKNIAKYSTKNAAVYIKAKLNVKANLSLKNQNKISEKISKIILTASNNATKVREIAKNFAMRVLTDKKASKDAKKMALNTFIKVSKSSEKKNSNKNTINNNKVKPSKISSTKLTKNIVKLVNNKKNISKKEVAKAEKNIIKKILKNTKNLKEATKVAHNMALKVINDKKSTVAMKKIAIKVYKKIEEKGKNTVNNKVKPTKITKSPRASSIANSKRVISSKVKKILKSIPKVIKNNNIKSSSKKIIDSIKNISNIKNNAKLNAIKKNISDKILKNSQNPTIAKKLLSNIIKNVVNNRKVSKRTKQMISKVAADVINKLKIEESKKSSS